MGFMGSDVMAEEYAQNFITWHGVGFAVQGVGCVCVGWCHGMEQCTLGERAGRLPACAAVPRRARI